jgi:hypothetical protein
MYTGVAATPAHAKMKEDCGSALIGRADMAGGEPIELLDMARWNEQKELLDGVLVGAQEVMEPIDDMGGDKSPELADGIAGE